VDEEKKNGLGFLIKLKLFSMFGPGLMLLYLLQLVLAKH
jgi:hypothetical protein